MQKKLARDMIREGKQTMLAVIFKGRNWPIAAVDQNKQHETAVRQYIIK